MCGRYYVDVELPSDVLRLVMTSEERYSDLSFYSETDKDICPTDKANIVVSEQNRLTVKRVKWGITNDISGQPLINARAETLFERKTFSESVIEGRCIVPARYFYEWDRYKNKCICRLKDKEPMFMAGLVKTSKQGPEFAIITTEANASMEGIHPRMPLVIPGKEARRWILEGGEAKGFLKRGSMEVEVHRDYEQLSFFD